MPGIIDLHVHLANTVDMVQDKRNFTKQSVEHDLQIYASYGVTTVMSLGTDSDLIFQLRAAHRADDSSMARFYTAGQGLVSKAATAALRVSINPRRSFFTRGVSAKSVQILADPQRQRHIAGGPHFAEYPGF